MRTILRNAGPYGNGRSTAQRRRIAATVPDRAFTVGELAEAVAAADPAIGLATVYRAVGAMERSGWLTRVGDVRGTTLYARCQEHEHHHHAVCTRCGRVEHTPCPVASAQGDSAPPGFRVTSHELTLYGLCETCGSEAAHPAGSGDGA
jgi:Fur family transcriptional regulator, ferric uptake regulator